jgi:beta-glucuronidase
MLDVSVELSDKTDAAAQLLIPRLGISQEIPVHGGKAEISMEAPEGLQLWTPEDPQLYGVTLRCGEDSVTDDVGFRTIEVSGTDILLNGKPVFLRGVSCHEDSERRGKALTTEDRTGIITIAKELGCNFMRLAHYPHSEEMSRLADRMGILLWEEVPVYWAIAFEDPDTLEDASNQLREMICRDRNRASVIIWSVGNENADTDARYRFMCTLADTARNSDPTRPVSAACLVNFPREVIDDRLADALDIIGVNEYCGWYIPDFSILPRILKNSRLTKPVIISEFGAGAKSGKHGNVQERWTEEYQAEVYRRQTETLGGIPYIKGMTPWILFDFRCPRRTSVLQNYYNLKGLVSADRRHRKMAFSVLQAFYRKLAGSPDPEETLHEKTDGSDACPADGAHENGLASGAH